MKLAYGNKPLNYLRCVFDKMALVGIGIRIALQINIRNKKRKSILVEVKMPKELYVVLKRAYSGGKLPFRNTNLNKNNHLFYLTL